MKLVEKWAELEQLMLKFVSRSRVRIFRNERTLSTPIGLETLVLLHFVKFECIWDRFVTALNSVQNEPNWSN